MQDNATKQKTAWKELNYYTDQEKQTLLQEAELMLLSCKNLRNPKSSSSSSSSTSLSSKSPFIHVVEPLGFIADEQDSKAYLVMEYYEGGDMRQYIKEMSVKGTEIKVDNAWKITGQIGLSLNQLHQNDIIHGDMKPENVLLTKDYYVKLADFGLSKMLEQGQTAALLVGGTLFYFAPEVLEVQKDDQTVEKEEKKDDQTEKEKKPKDNVQKFWRL
ncbi:MAG: putative Protein kinase [Streblomastix strix]|uniref:non-specific serine/threonine protein kinase n=1 Tax=Streblomastix strix TaxID=222440 RepID=A0A5J4UNL2_9EUKA|nr:MAG: putative Protein kinase [Streblomastix strix]